MPILKLTDYNFIREVMFKILNLETILRILAALLVNLKQNSKYTKARALLIKSNSKNGKLYYRRFDKSYCHHQEID